MNTTVAEKRPLGALGRMGMVAGLHVAALYLIATSLGIVPKIAVDPPVITLATSDPAPPEPQPEVPRPEKYQPDIHVPTPAVPIDVPDTENQIIAQQIDIPPIIDNVTTEPQPTLVSVRQDSRYPLTQPTYPARDIREGNEGTVELEIYVLPTGRIGDARVIRSAGSPSLDQSAIDEAKRKWRMLPATRDGEPYAQWHRLKVTFNLKNR